MKITIKTRNKKVLYAGSLFTLIIIMVLSYPILFNLRAFVGYGSPSVEENYYVNYSNGDGGLNVKLSFIYEEEIISPLSLSSGSKVEFRRYIYFNTISSGSVVPEGISSLHYTIYLDGIPLLDVNNYLDPPLENVEYSALISIEKWANYTIKGYVNASYHAESILNNETINFALTIISDIGDTDIFEFDLMVLWLEMLNGVFIILLIFGVVKILRGPVRFRYDEEMQKRDKEYLEYLRKRKESEES